MKKIYTLLFLVLFVMQFAYSQRGSGGFGVYFGYSMGKYAPGLGNIQNTTNLYDQNYGGDFNYKGVLQGPAIGCRIAAGFYQMDFEWIFRHSKDVSEFIEPTSLEAWKLGIKTRYNTWFWGHALRYKNFALGAGLDIGRFKIFTKRTALAEYDATKWSRTTIYGEKIALSKMLDITGGFIFYFDYMPKILGVRFYYALPIGDEEFADDASLSFYSFYPGNFGASLLFNFSNIN